CARLFSWSLWPMLHNRLFANDVLQQRNHLVGADLLGAADVVDRAGGEALMGKLGRAHNVADVSVAAQLVATAEDRDGASLEDALDEDVVAHIGALARTIDREVAQNGGRQAKLRVI